MTLTLPIPAPASMDAPTVQVAAMSRAEFEKLPEWPKAEWVHGKAYIDMAPVAVEHGGIAGRLIILLGNSLVDVDVMPEVGYRMVDSDRGPDIIVVPHGSASGSWVTQTPLLVAEVVSPGSRTQDYFIKAKEYAQAGAAYYLIADPMIKAITILSNDGTGGWNLVADVNSEHPTASFQVGDYGTVTLDFDKIF